LEALTWKVLIPPVGSPFAIHGANAWAALWTRPVWRTLATIQRRPDCT